MIKKLTLLLSLSAIISTPALAANPTSAGSCHYYDVLIQNPTNKVWTYRIKMNHGWADNYSGTIGSHETATLRTWQSLWGPDGSLLVTDGASVEQAHFHQNLCGLEAGKIITSHSPGIKLAHLRDEEGSYARSMNGRSYFQLGY